MSKSQHSGTGDAPQNQNNAMSDDPGDGQRKSFTAQPEKSKAEGAPEEQGEERLEELGREGSKQD
jgi:hypothetical protein